MTRAADVRRDGTCSACSEPLAAHYDARNAFVGCHGAMVASGRWATCDACAGTGWRDGQRGSRACDTCGGSCLTMRPAQSPYVEVDSETVGGDPATRIRLSRSVRVF